MKETTYQENKIYFLQFAQWKKITFNINESGEVWELTKATLLYTVKVSFSSIQIQDILWIN